MNVLGKSFALALLILAVTASSASATLYPYYGFNNLSSTYPTGQCAQDLSWVGIACNQFQTWPHSTVSKVNGDSIRVGFRTDTGVWYVQMDSSFNGFLTHVNQAGIGAPEQNRCYCKYQSGTQSYVRCYGELP